MRTFAQRHPLLWLYLFFGYFSIVHQGLVYATGLSGWSGLRQSLLMSVIWLLPVMCWPRRIRALTAIIGLMLGATSMISLGYWLIYGQDFSQSAIFILFESNATEGGEFIRSYLRWWHPLVFIAYALPPLLLWQQMPRLTLARRQRSVVALLCSTVFMAPLISALLQNQNGQQAFYHWTHRLQPAAPWNLVIGYRKYREQLDDMQRLLSQNTQAEQLHHFTVDPTRQPDTLVLVIGESTNRNRMSLYGYPRPTTPNLDALRDELVVFKDVISPRPYTIEALQQVLSFADTQDLNAFFDQPNLLNMLKRAGYEITWITNQQTQTRRNTMLTTLSQMADHQVYLNNNLSQNASQYDGAVLEPFDQALHSRAKKQLIVVHLLGTHRSYHYRYPESFAYFNDHQGVPAWVGADMLEEYNSYDNAVRYNDFVVSRLISRLRAASDNALLVYFSDHGEEVYDQPESLFTGRNEGKPTPAMYTVPFILWSNARALRAPMQQWHRYTDRAFMSADLIHTIPDMIGIGFDELDHSRSLVSTDFTRRPRMIGLPGQQVEFDSLTRQELADTPRSAALKTLVSGAQTPAPGA